jgi:2,3-bisphosphoglycerate-dependent phosphoglycerate mutase
LARWYLVRHGVTEWNSSGRLQGQTDIPLSEAGREEGRLTAKRLTGVPFVAAYTSDLVRAKETADLVLQGQDVSLFLTPELRELDYGEWEGRTFKWIEEGNPSGSIQNIAKDPDFAPPGGESTAQLCDRVMGMANRLMDAHGDDDLLVVGHGGSLRALAVGMLGLSAVSLWRMGTSTASVSILRRRDEGWQLELWNDTSHLEPLRNE